MLERMETEGSGTFKAVNGAHCVGKQRVWILHVCKDEGWAKQERGKETRNTAECAEGKYALNWGKMILHFLHFTLD